MQKFDLISWLKTLFYSCTALCIGKKVRKSTNTALVFVLCHLAYIQINFNLFVRNGFRLFFVKYALLHNSIRMSTCGTFGLFIVCTGTELVDANLGHLFGLYGTHVVIFLSVQS